MSYFNYQPKRIFIKRQAMENHLGLGNGKSIRKINLSLLKSRVSKMIPVKNNKSWKIHSIQIKILMISVLIALGTTIVSLVISYYTEINTIKKRQNFI